MEPINFKGANCIFGGEGQSEYMPLPAHKDENGVVLTCWKLSPEDMQRIQETGVIWLEMLTFDEPLMPVRLDSIKPYIGNEEL